MDSLVNNSELKSEYWREMVENHSDANHICYDKVLDTLILYVDCPKGRIITHYLDSNVALLYKHSDKQIVGIRIESFTKSFKPYLQKNKTWKLSEKNIHINGIADMIFGIKTPRTKMALQLDQGVNLVPEFA